MENYQKGKNVEEPFERENVPVFLGRPDDFFWMKVTGASKMRNLLEVALPKFEVTRNIVWSASGPAISKAISCVEVLKRKSSTKPHQVTKIGYRSVDEFWDPIIESLAPIIVRREIPCIHIFLSMDPIDTQQSGYQAPGPLSWKGNTEIRSNRPKSIKVSEEEMQNLGLRTEAMKKKKPSSKTN